MHLYCCSTNNSKQCNVKHVAMFGQNHKRPIKDLFKQINPLEHIPTFLNKEQICQ